MNVLAEVSDAVWLALIAAVVTLANGIMSQRTKAAVEKTAADAAVAVKEVKTTLESTTSAATEKIEDLSKTAESIHTLVNSSMSAQLKISAVALRRVAEITKNPEDETAAGLAENLYHEHEKKQAIVDSVAGKPAKITA